MLWRGTEWKWRTIRKRKPPRFRQMTRRDASSTEGSVIFSWEYGTYKKIVIMASALSLSTFLSSLVLSLPQEGPDVRYIAFFPDGHQFHGVYKCERVYDRMH